MNFTPVLRVDSAVLLLGAPTSGRDLTITDGHSAPAERVIVAVEPAQPAAMHG